MWISYKRTYPGVSRKFQWKSYGCVDLRIPISGAKQLGALATLGKSYRWNTFHNMNTCVSLYKFFWKMFFTPDHWKVRDDFIERRLLYVIVHLVYSCPMVRRKKPTDYFRWAWSARMVPQRFFLCITLTTYHKNMIFLPLVHHISCCWSASNWGLYTIRNDNCKEHPRIIILEILHIVLVGILFSMRAWINR